MADLAEAQGQLDEKQAELDSAQKEYEKAINEKQVNKVEFWGKLIIFGTVMKLQGCEFPSILS